MTSLALRSIGRLSRRAIDTALESRVAKATPTTFRNHLSLIRFSQITDQLTGIDVMYDCPLRHSYFEVRTRPTSLVSA
jgi:hypothetical protein